jgi:hypothetical protein
MSKISKYRYVGRRIFTFYFFNGKLLEIISFNDLLKFLNDQDIDCFL